MPYPTPSNVINLLILFKCGNLRLTLISIWVSSVKKYPGSLLRLWFFSFENTWECFLVTYFCSDRRNRRLWEEESVVTSTHMPQITSLASFFVKLSLEELHILLLPREMSSCVLTASSIPMSYFLAFCRFYSLFSRNYSAEDPCHVSHFCCFWGNPSRAWLQLDCFYTI